MQYSKVQFEVIDTVKCHAIQYTAIQTIEMYNIGHSWDLLPYS